MGNAIKAKVLIAGCGYVGIPLARLLNETGHTVFGLRRDPSKLPDFIIPVSADLSRPLPDDLLSSSLDAVIYTASATGRREESVYSAIYVDGPAYVLQWIQRNHPMCRRFVFTSSTSVYGQADGSWVDEDSPVENPAFSGRLMREGEAQVHTAPISSVVVRFSGIYGPGRHRLIRQVVDEEAWIPENTHYLNHIHMEDCAGVLAHMLQLKNPDPLYLASDHEPVDRAEVLGWIANELGRPLVESALPVRRPGSNKRCRNQRLLDSGYTFTYPSYREGYAKEIACHVR